MRTRKLLSLLLAVAIMSACYTCLILCKATESDYMYHITATGNNVKPLQKTANLVKGNSYTAKFKYKMVSGTYNTSFFFCITKAQQVAENVTGKGTMYFDSREESHFIEISEGTDGWRTLAYTFEFDDHDDITIPSGTVKTDLGFKIDRRISEFYIADFTVYDISDPDRTNLFLVPGASQGVWDWHSDYYTSSADDVSFETSAYTIECVEMDESLFRIPPSGPCMYHITATGNNVKPLQKTANLVKGNTYTAKFKYKMVSGTYNTSFFFCITKAQQVAENVTGKGTMYFDGREDSQFVEIAEGTDGWRTLAYTFEFDDHDDVTIPSGTVKTDLGFKIDRRISEFYIADFTVYDISDPDRTNLFLVPDASRGVWDWHSDYYTSSADDVSFETSAYTIECLPMDESLFSIPIIGHNMLRVENYGRKYQYLVQHVNLQKGKTYTLSFLYHFDAGDFNSSVYVWLGGAQNYKTGRRPTTYFMSHRTDAMQFDSVKYATEQSKIFYTFTLNDEEGAYELPEGEELYSIGFAFENANTGSFTDLYIADMVLYDCEDEKETNLLPVTNYSNGLYGWGCQWIGAEKNATSFTHSSCDYTVTYLPYDKDLFEKYAFGDANQDGKINIIDLIKTKKLIVNLEYSAFADSCRDGAVDARDLTALVNHLLGAAELTTLIAPTKQKEGAAQLQSNALRQTIANASDTVSAAASNKKTYYVDSAAGNDSNSGTSSSRALKTIDALSLKTLNSGDIVLFKRGSVFRTSAVLKLVSGVFYGTYGTGEKPIIKGSLQDYAYAEWVSVGGGVWKLAFPVSGEAGVVTFDHDTAVGFRKMSLAGLNKNGDYYHDYEVTGDFYLYLDGVNPSDYFNNIEIGSSYQVLSGIYQDTAGSYSRSNITINNISLMYFGSGLGLTYCSNIRIIGCEFSWIGGTVASSGNTRKGNAITIWRNCNGVYVDKCLFHQIFDAGFTFQGQGDQSYQNVSVTNSLFWYNSMNFEFWGDDGDYETTIRNITFSGNIVRFAGLGFGGIQRQHKTDQGVILGWEKEYDANDTVSGFVISNNIFDTSDCYIYRVSDTLPINFSGNTYYQGKHSFTVNPNSDIIAVDQATLESVIATFDSDPALVRWLR